MFANTSSNAKVRAGGRGRMLALAAVVTMSGMTLGGCAQNDAQGGALLGAGLGAIAGAVIGHQSGHGGEGAAIGAGAGALGGYIFGNESDKQRYQQQRYSNYRY